MTEKEKLIARLNELGAQLGREVNTSGTIQELSMRIAELEEELNDGTDTDSVENGGVSDGSASTGAAEPVPPVDTVLSGRTDSARMAVETLATLHIEALHATRDERVPPAYGYPAENGTKKGPIVCCVLALFVSPGPLFNNWKMVAGM